MWVRRALWKHVLTGRGHLEKILRQLNTVGGGGGRNILSIKGNSKVWALITTKEKGWQGAQRCQVYLKSPLSTSTEGFLSGITGKGELESCFGVFLFVFLRDAHVWVHAKSSELHPTLCNPMDYSPPGSSVHGILQARRLEWVATPSARGSSWPRDGSCISYVSCISRQVPYH